MFKAIQRSMLEKRRIQGIKTYVPSAEVPTKHKCDRLDIGQIST